MGCIMKIQFPCKTCLVQSMCTQVCETTLLYIQTSATDIRHKRILGRFIILSIYIISITIFSFFYPSIDLLISLAISIAFPFFLLSILDSYIFKRTTALNVETWRLYDKISERMKSIKGVRSK